MLSSLEFASEIGFARKSTPQREARAVRRGATVAPLVSALKEDAISNWQRVERTNGRRDSSEPFYVRGFQSGLNTLAQQNLNQRG